MTRLAAAALLIVGCTPAPTPAQTQTQTPTQTPAPSRGRTNVDARLDFEEGPDPDYGEGATSVRCVLSVPALSIRRALFAVPFPYACRRRDSDAGDELVVECAGDDGVAYARVRTDPGHIVVIARDYGRLESAKTEDAIALPSQTTVTLFAPLKFPQAR